MGGHRGNNSEFEFRASGAYIFRPESGGPDPIPGGWEDTLVKGTVVDELVRAYSDWVMLVIRLYHQTKTVEIGWQVGPIPVDDYIGKEVVLRYASSVENEGRFKTDSLGRQLMERVRDYRPTFEINQTEPESQNYYPVASTIMIEDETHQLAVLTDRPQGGTSPSPGSVELMLHRRLLDDDAFGVGEALNEVAYGQGLVVTGRHWLLLNSNEVEMAAERRFHALQMYSAPLLLIGHPPSLPSCLQQPLPAQINILSLQHLLREGSPSSSVLLLHLEHLFQEDEHPTLGSPASIDLASTFSCFRVTAARETTIGGARWRDEVQRFTFEKETAKNEEEGNKEASFGNRGNESAKSIKPDIFTNYVDDTVVTLGPMEIRAFVLEVIYE